MIVVVGGVLELVFNIMQFGENLVGVADAELGSNVGGKF